MDLNEKNFSGDYRLVVKKKTAEASASEHKSYSYLDMMAKAAARTVGCD